MYENNWRSREQKTALFQETEKFFNEYVLILSTEIKNSQLFAHQYLKTGETIENLELDRARQRSEKNTFFTIKVHIIQADGKKRYEILMVKCSKLETNPREPQRDINDLQKKALFLQDVAATREMGNKVTPIFSYYIDEAMMIGVEAMPFYIADNLSEQIATGQLTSWHQVEAAIRSLTDVVAYFHFQGKVHGDIKPANFLSNQSNSSETSFLVTDSLESMFDINFDPNDEPGMNNVLAASMVKSLFYADDRYFEGGPQVKDFGYDLYSLAVSLYQILNRNLYPYEDPQNRMTNIRQRIIVVFQNRYYPLHENLQTAIEFAEQPEVVDQLQALKNFVRALDEVLHEALFRVQGDDSFDNQGGFLVAKFRKSFLALIKQAKSENLNLDALVTILNLAHRDRTAQAITQIFTPTMLMPMTEPEVLEVAPDQAIVRTPEIGKGESDSAIKVSPISKEPVRIDYSLKIY